MRKIQKNKKGFTLIEMVLVIAIIVILASVLFVGISGYLNKANTVKVIASARDSKAGSLTAQIDVDASKAMAVS